MIEILVDCDCLIVDLQLSTKVAAKNHF